MAHKLALVTLALAAAAFAQEAATESTPEEQAPEEIPPLATTDDSEHVPKDIPTNTGAIRTHNGVVPIADWSKADLQKIKQAIECSRKCDNGDLHKCLIARVPDWPDKEPDKSFKDAGCELPDAVDEESMDRESGEKVASDLLPYKLAATQLCPDGPDIFEAEDLTQILGFGATWLVSSSTSEPMVKLLEEKQCQTTVSSEACDFCPDEEKKNTCVVAIEKQLGQQHPSVVLAGLEAQCFTDFESFDQGLVEEVRASLPWNQGIRNGTLTKNLAYYISYMASFEQNCQDDSSYEAAIAAMEALAQNGQYIDIDEDDIIQLHSEHGCNDYSMPSGPAGDHIFRAQALGYIAGGCNIYKSILRGDYIDFNSDYSGYGPDDELPNPVEPGAWGVDGCQELAQDFTCNNGCYVPMDPEATEDDAKEESHDTEKSDETKGKSDESAEKSDDIEDESDDWEEELEKRAEDGEATSEDSDESNDTGDTSDYTAESDVTENQDSNTESNGTDGEETDDHAAENGSEEWDEESEGMVDEEGGMPEPSVPKEVQSCLDRFASEQKETISNPAIPFLAARCHKIKDSTKLIQMMFGFKSAYSGPSLDTTGSGSESISPIMPALMLAGVSLVYLVVMI